MCCGGEKPDFVCEQVTVLDPQRVLLIQFNRLKRAVGGSITKNEQLIDYPISKMKFAGKTYDLVAVCEHIPDHDSPSIGHNVTSVKSMYRGTWWRIRDDVVEPIVGEPIPSKQATMLVYMRRSRPKAVKPTLKDISQLRDPPKALKLSQLPQHWTLYDTVEKWKYLFLETYGGEFDRLAFFHQGQRLENERTMYYYGVTTDSVIMIVWSVS